ncbi:aldehyde dehydrogenase family protein [Blastococcus sp. URHD0036]|uniref:aldehyde dehydrogenase family protein n=1 Tax=Blastococcus sp. URHD0036 TaxID=1380356 RepID=UPI00068BB9DA|nr:aldehyde dehydrogenase family protein [Blastococcus sp. URHD0036]
MTAVQSESGVLAGEERILIDGELVETASGAKFDVENPALGEIAGQCTDGTAADVDRAVKAARRAFEQTKWKHDVEFRYHCLMQLHRALEEEQERLRRIVVTETGTPLLGTHGIQIAHPVEESGYWPEFGRSFEYLREIGTDTAMGMSSRRITQYDPIGVVAAITPWNTPLYLNVAESVPPLMAGNAVVLKPAQLTPWMGTELGRIVAEKTDIPPGIFNVVVGESNEVGAALASHPDVDMVTFTGSTAVGRSILAAGASTVKKVMLELGGKSSLIALDDADLMAVLPTAAGTACFNSGQSCTLASRILLPRSRYEEGIAILKGAMEMMPYGDPWDMNNIQGAQISRIQQQKVLGLIQAGIESGARLVTGGKAPEGLPGYFTMPTVLADVDPKSRIGQEEIFGPVLTVTPYDTEEEAIAISNDTIYGLSGEVASADEDRALKVALQMRAGTMVVNGGSYFGLRTPLGGYKQSGLGRRNGHWGFEEYMEIKAIGLPIRDGEPSGPRVVD